MLDDAGIAVLGRAEADAEAVHRRGMGGDLDMLEEEDEGRALLMLALKRAVERGAALGIALAHRGLDLLRHLWVGPGIAPGRRLLGGVVGGIGIDDEGLG